MASYAICGGTLSEYSRRCFRTTSFRSLGTLALPEEGLWNFLHEQAALLFGAVAVEFRMFILNGLELLRGLNLEVSGSRGAEAQPGVQRSHVCRPTT